MLKRELSHREEEIVQLCIEGLTNDAIAHRLNISIGTVNTYWLRIKLKVGGLGKTDTVIRIIKDRGDKALHDSSIERVHLAEIIAETEKMLLEKHAALALLQLAMDTIKSTVWAADTDLMIYALANGDFPATHFGVTWEVGKTVYEIFKTNDPEDIAIAAHQTALNGEKVAVELTGEFHGMFLQVLPLIEEDGEIIGCVAIVNSVQSKSTRSDHSK